MSVVGDRAVSDAYLYPDPNGASPISAPAPNFSLRIVSFSGWDPPSEAVSSASATGVSVWVGPNGSTYSLQYRPWFQTDYLTHTHYFAYAVWSSIPSLPTLAISNSDWSFDSHTLAASLAAIDAVTQVLPQSIASDTEYVGVIYFNPATGQIGYTSAIAPNNIIDRSPWTLAPIPNSTISLAWWHTHGADPIGGNFFSESDVGMSNYGDNRRRVPGFVGTPNGALLMIPPTGTNGWQPSYVNLDPNPITRFSGVNNPIIILPPSL